MADLKPAAAYLRHKLSAVMTIDIQNLVVSEHHPQSTVLPQCTSEGLRLVDDKDIGGLSGVVRLSTWYRYLSL